MKLSLPLLLIIATGALSGCATPAQTYARQHPELPAAQLEILRTGKVPDGTAIAGMTREQVQLAMSMDPTQYTKVDGHDAWVYVRKTLTSTGFTTATPELDKRDKRNRDGAEDDNRAYQNAPQTKTTIYFDGNVATHAEVVNGGL